MKKFLIPICLAAVGLFTFSSCLNSDGDDYKTVTDEARFTNVMANFMGAPLVTVFRDVESVTTKVVDGTITNITDGFTIIGPASNPTGWSYDFTTARYNENFLQYNGLNYLGGKISVTLTSGSSLIADNAVLLVDCSQTTYNYNDVNRTSLNLFGTMDIINTATSATNTTRGVNTHNFGYGESATVDTENTGNYVFKSTFSNNALSTLTISGNASGTCKVLKNDNVTSTYSYNQTISNELSYGGYAAAFSKGSIIYNVLPAMTSGASVINVTYAPSSYTVSYNGQTITYP